MSTFTTQIVNWKIEKEMARLGHVFPLWNRKLAFIHKQLVKMSSFSDHEQGKGHPFEPQHPMMGGIPISYPQEALLTQFGCCAIEMELFRWFKDHRAPNDSTVTC